MDAVLETYEATDFALWPVADPSSDRLLVLSGELSERETGTAMAVLTGCNAGDQESTAAAVEDRVARQVGHLVTSDAVIAPGGLRLRDTTTGVTAPPGCCCGLEDWRDWLGLLNGEQPWLGHDPSPRVEHIGTSLRLWPDGERPQGPHIVVPPGQLPELLCSVQQRLSGFLACVAAWADRHAPALSAAVVARLDADLAIGAPLPDARG
ncbi:hypothetical protein ACGFW5_31530 [Streptomyces sp. NPDC048416]|uniref:hypothetical protein n=1 Tax=Streptomyces sp. NPDC048416 TaxID=3365546 RepID=UPI003714B705